MDINNDKLREIVIYQHHRAITSLYKNFLTILEDIKNSRYTIDENTYNNFLRDSVNWGPISRVYTATGGERFLTLGNFHNDATTDTSRMNPGIYNNSYYFIDDVSVVEMAIDYANVQGCRITPNLYTMPIELDVLVKALTALAENKQP